MCVSRTYVCVCVYVWRERVNATRHTDPQHIYLQLSSLILSFITCPNCDFPSPSHFSTSLSLCLPLSFFVCVSFPPLFPSPSPPLFLCLWWSHSFHPSLAWQQPNRIRLQTMQARGQQGELRSQPAAGFPVSRSVQGHTEISGLGDKVAAWCSDCPSVFFISEVFAGVRLQSYMTVTHFKEDRPWK